MFEILQYLSILIESAVAIIGGVIYLHSKRKCGLGIFTTFTIYVFYDLTKQMDLVVNPEALYVLFFIATWSALFTVLALYRENRILKNKK